VSGVSIVAFEFARVRGERWRSYQPSGTGGKLAGMTKWKSRIENSNILRDGFCCAFEKRTKMKWRQITDDVVVMSFPWHTFGIDFHRNVTLLRLRDGRVVIHSSAPFTAEDTNVICRFGEPAWLVEATLMHDTFAKQGRAAFPDLPYLAPNDFTKATGIPTQPLGSPPLDWKDEIDVLKIDGNKMNEYVLFHRRAATLVVADLFFSFPRETRGWARFFVRHIMRLPRLFGISLFFRVLMIRDRNAFKNSMRALWQWNFERIVVAHREPVESDARATVERALRDHGFLNHA
jgi:hypothetical protein